MSHSKGLIPFDVTLQNTNSVPLILVFIGYYADYCISLQMYIGFCLTKRLLSNIIYFALSPLAFISFKAFWNDLSQFAQV